MSDISRQELAEKCVNYMVERDEFSRWLGMRLLEIKPGKVRAEMKVRREMLNGFAVSHGGVVFSFADSAFAFACNTHGKISVSIENSISYPNPIKEGDVLRAVAEEESVSNSVGFYRVVVTNQREEKVAIFRGTVYRTKKDFFAEGTS